MIVAVISGKGGTGKTTLATALALAWSREAPLTLADSDVEGPNAYRYLPGLDERESRPVQVDFPEIDATLCHLCGACAALCRFGALVPLREKIHFVSSQCHACGGCGLVCPSGAISTRPHAMGKIRRASSERVTFFEGVLDIGESRATPVVDALLDAACEASAAGGDLILDGPPGASCAVAAVVQAAEICLLVAEPTPFGLHDLEQVHALVALRAKPSVVVLNRSRGGEEDTQVERWCAAHGLPLVMRIPHTRAVAAAYAAGRPPLELLPGIEERLVALRARLAEQLAREVRGAWATGDSFHGARANGSRR